MDQVVFQSIGKLEDRWIPIQEKLPVRYPGVEQANVSDWVLVAFPVGKFMAQRIGSYDYALQAWDILGNKGLVRSDRVTHWRPLPPDPPLTLVPKVTSETDS